MTQHVPHSLEALKAFVPERDNFVGIDSDGCVFDTMEIKQKVCFHGLIASHWELQSIEALVRETAEFVNLYSCWRGQNRFVALVKCFDLLRERPEVAAAGLDIPRLDDLRAYQATGAVLGDVAMRTYADRTGSYELASLLAWSANVNTAIEANVKDIPPFPWALESLKALQAASDVVCVSQTPTEALVREWSACSLTPYLRLIAGQELGTKAKHLELATSGRYAPDRVLMIGDAPGDRRAADANSALFYPINPGHEDASWQRFHDEGYARFLEGHFAGDYQQALIAEFEALLPETPPWLAE